MSVAHSPPSYEKVLCEQEIAKCEEIIQKITEYCCKMYVSWKKVNMDRNIVDFNVAESIRLSRITESIYYYNNKICELNEELYRIDCTIEMQELEEINRQRKEKSFVRRFLKLFK